MIVLYIVLAVIVIFLAVLLIRAALFRPHPELIPSGRKWSLTRRRSLSDMVEMIRCKTVSYNDESLIDKAGVQRNFRISSRSFIRRCMRPARASSWE